MALSVVAVVFLHRTLSPLPGHGPGFPIIASRLVSLVWANRCFMSYLTVNRKQLDMSSDVPDRRSPYNQVKHCKTTFKENIPTLQSGKSDQRKVSPYPSRHRTAQDTRRTDAARRWPRPTEPWEEYDTDPAMNIIVVLLFPGRKEERQRRGREESHPL